MQDVRTLQLTKEIGAPPTIAGERSTIANYMKRPTLVEPDRELLGGVAEEEEETVACNWEVHR